MENTNRKIDSFIDPNLVSFTREDVKTLMGIALNDGMTQIMDFCHRKRHMADNDTSSDTAYEAVIEQAKAIRDGEMYVPPVPIRSEVPTEADIKWAEKSIEEYKATADRVIEKEGEFEREISAVINRFSKENGSNTPDFILAEYLNECLKAFNTASRAREKWYGKSLSIVGNEKTEMISPYVIRERKPTLEEKQMNEARSVVADMFGTGKGTPMPQEDWDKINPQP